MNKPSLAIYGPCANDRSGVVEYSSVLSASLSVYFDCFLLNNENSECPSKFDYVLYNIGNNSFHRCSFEAIKKRRGVCILHEFNCLDYYLSNWELLTEYDQNFLLRGYSTQLNIDFKSKTQLDSFFDSRRDLDRYSFDLWIEGLFLKEASSILVHSIAVADFLKARYSHLKVNTINQPIPEIEGRTFAPDDDLSGDLNSEFIFGTFGFIGEYKRIEKIFDAWEIIGKRYPMASLLIVGQKQYPVNIPNDKNIYFLDYVHSHDHFNKLLISVDCGIQLRFPTLGETSATVSKFLAHSIPVIISDNLFWKDLQKSPLTTAVPVGASEVELLIDSMEKAIKKGKSTPRFNREYSPDVIAEKVFSELVGN